MNEKGVIYLSKLKSFQIRFGKSAQSICKLTTNLYVLHVSCRPTGK